jgi:hypothetical protein
VTTRSTEICPRAAFLANSFAMRKVQKRPGLLVVVEIGAEWPARALTERPGSMRRVVAQSEGETPEAFAARLGSLVARLFSPGVELRDAVLACNERTDSAASVARRAIGALVLERLGATGAFVFAAGSRSGGRLRHALTALAIDLAPEAKANVGVHFDAERADTDASSERAVARVA